MTKTLFCLLLASSFTFIEYWKGSGCRCAPVHAPSTRKSSNIDTIRY